MVLSRVGVMDNEIRLMSDLVALISKDQVIFEKLEPGGNRFRSINTDIPFIVEKRKSGPVFLVEGPGVEALISRHAFVILLLKAIVKQQERQGLDLEFRGLVDEYIK